MFSQQKLRWENDAHPQHLHHWANRTLQQRFQLVTKKYSIFQQLNSFKKEQLSTVLDEKHLCCSATAKPKKSVQKKTGIGISMRNRKHRIQNWKYPPQQPHSLQQPKSPREIHPPT